MQATGIQKTPRTAAHTMRRKYLRTLARFHRYGDIYVLWVSVLGLTVVAFLSAFGQLPGQ